MVMTHVGHGSSVTELLRRHATERPDSEALVWVHDVEEDRTTRLSYAQLDAQARSVASWLRERLPAGSRVLLLYPPVNFIAGFLGCLYAGMVAVPAPLPGRYAHERDRVRRIAIDAEASAILTDQASTVAVAAWAADQGLDDLLTLATDSAGAGLPDTWSMPVIGHDTVALLQYTSGSTDEPKGVILTHGNLLANARALCETLDLPRDTRFGGWAPHYHDMGLMAQTLPALLRGSTCVLLEPATFIKRPHHWLRMIDRYDIGWSAAPNFGYELCVHRVTDEQIADLDLSRWRYAVNGSEPVQVSTLVNFAKRFAPAGFRGDAVRPCYGLAEATVFVSGASVGEPTATRVDADALEQHEFRPARPGHPARELASNGVAADYDVRIVDPETGSDVDLGRIGEIWLRGPSVSQGYWRNEPATAVTFRASASDGSAPYLRTGDLGTVHDGELYVTGRRKEVLFVNGRNVYPQDIEHEMRSQHLELGNVGAAFTVPVRAADGASEDEVLVLTHEVSGRLDAPACRELAVQIKQTVAREFGIAAGAVALLRRGSVRRTTSGKIQRSAMRRLFLAGELDAEYSEVNLRLRDGGYGHTPSGAAPEEVAEQVESWLTTQVGTRLRGAQGQVRRDVLLAEYGLDSVNAVELCLDIEDRWGLRLEPTAAWDHPTVGELAGFVAAELTRIALS